ncbi:hypothetical protein BKA70DRAFT_1514516 [Coprinopsis sp. MPI-PUGE-AT-0042]|nr:hypothetical protein BKA70DRAFT_1514516 [Coprinopsis sp. MPI-PUGE-AT-0042]
MPPNTSQVEASTASPTHAITKGKAASTVNISGGSWNKVEGNQSFQFIGCNVALNTHVGLGAYTHASTSSAQHSYSASGMAPRACKMPESDRAQDYIPCVQFLLVKNTLQLAKQLVAPHTTRNKTGIFKGVVPHLHDLEVLIDFCSSAYDACSGGTTIGKLIKAAIEARMEACNQSLSQLHADIAHLPRCPFPRIEYLHRVIHEWWTDNEAGEIATIRRRISEEVKAIGEWLWCLHSFWWASSQLLLATSKFTMKGLYDFLQSGPVTLLHDIEIEEIVFLEPLQGEPRSIPIRFVESFEDIHTAVEMACQGTAASHFIERRQYQSDESSTDARVNEDQVLQCFEECREFEVSILLSRLGIPSNVCPRCKHLHDGHHDLNGWLKCPQCGTKFNGRLSPGMDPADDKTQEPLGHRTTFRRDEDFEIEIDAVYVEDVLEQILGTHTTSVQSEIEPTGDVSGHSLTDTNVAQLFRRVIFEAQKGVNLNPPSKQSWPSEELNGSDFRSNVDIADSALSSTYDPAPREQEREIREGGDYGEAKGPRVDYEGEMGKPKDAEESLEALRHTPAAPVQSEGVRPAKSAQVSLPKRSSPSVGRSEIATGVGPLIQVRSQDHAAPNSNTSIQSQTIREPQCGPNSILGAILVGASVYGLELLRGKMTADGSRHSHAEGPRSPPSEDARTGLSGQQPPDIARGSHGSTSGEYSMIFHNICRAILGKEGILEVLEYPESDGRWHALASVRDPTSQRVIRLGHAQGLSKSLARSSAAFEACMYLQKQFPDQILTDNDGKFILAPVT